MQDRARQQEDAKNSILSQIMDQNARARCEYFCSYFLFFVTKQVMRDVEYFVLFVDQ